MNVVDTQKKLPELWIDGVQCRHAAFAFYGPSLGPVASVAAGVPGRASQGEVGPRPGLRPMTPHANHPEHPGITHLCPQLDQGLPTACDREQGSQEVTSHAGSIAELIWGFVGREGMVSIVGGPGGLRQCLVSSLRLNSLHAEKKNFLTKQRKNTQTSLKVPF